MKNKLGLGGEICGRTWVVKACTKKPTISGRKDITSLLPWYCIRSQQGQSTGETHKVREAGSSSFDLWWLKLGIGGRLYVATATVEWKLFKGLQFSDEFCVCVCVTVLYLKPLKSATEQASLIYSFVQFTTVENIALSYLSRTCGACWSSSTREVTSRPVTRL